MKFLITSQLFIDADSYKTAADQMEAVDGVVYGAFKRVIEPLIDGSFSLTTETTLAPADDAAEGVFPEGRLGKFISTGFGREAVSRPRPGEKPRPGIARLTLQKDPSEDAD